jgi:hypothetical protein
MHIIGMLSYIQYPAISTDHRRRILAKKSKDEVDLMRQKLDEMQKSFGTLKKQMGELVHLRKKFAQAVRKQRREKHPSR